MKLAIMQPYFLPYIGYWQLINAADAFVVYDDVNYMKKSYINHNSIVVNGKPWRFTLEVMGASQNKRINEMVVGNNAGKLLKTISYAYKKSPYYSKIFPLLEKIFLCDEKNLVKYIVHSLRVVMNYLEIITPLIYSSNVEKDCTLAGQFKIVDICKKLNATIYFNPIGGRALYDKKVFLNENIELFLLKNTFNNNSIENLSIIDVLFCNAKQMVQKMLGAFTLS